MNTMRAVIDGMVRAVRGFLARERFATSHEQVTEILDNLAGTVLLIEQEGLSLHYILEHEAEALDAYLRGTEDFPIRDERNADLLEQAVIWKTVAAHALKHSG